MGVPLGGVRAARVDLKDGLEGPCEYLMELSASALKSPLPLPGSHDFGSCKT
jgi:hypothetical protein